MSSEHIFSFFIKFKTFASCSSLEFEERSMFVFCHVTSPRSHILFMFCSLFAL